jgi:hypothetical protein
MRFTWDKDTKTVAGGAALALTCGLMLGGAMRPDLGDDGRPAGPQQIAGWSATRSTGPFDPGATATYASYSGAGYSGQVPDYVIGTDWKKTLAWPDERAAVSPPARAEAVRDEAPPPDESPEWAAPVSRAAYEPPPAPHGRYPSMGDEAPAAPPDDDAPAPVITG